MDYKKERAANATENLKLLLDKFPEYCRDYFTYCDGTLDRSALTMLNYAYDLNTFFSFLLSVNPSLKCMKDITLDVLDSLRPKDIQEYMFYLKKYEKSYGNGEKTITNDAGSRARKLSSLRSFYQYYFRNGDISNNPAKMIDSPSIHKKKLPKLDKQEVSDLIDGVAYSTALTDKQKPYAENTKYRDYAIIMLLIGTGIRVSELVGLDLDDVDWKHNEIKIIRKGGNEDIVSLPEEVTYALIDYIEQERKPFNDSNNALFLSSRNDHERLTTRSVERLVKKYGKNAVFTKKVTPHTLRRTYGTNMYNQSRDIYLTAQALGDSSIEVVQHHYVEMQSTAKDDILRHAASIFQESDNK